MSRAGADRAGQQRFGEMDQVGIGLEFLGRFGAALLRVRGKCIVRAALAEKAPDQRDQFVDRGVAAQRFRALQPRFALRIDE